MDTYIHVLCFTSHMVCILSIIYDLQEKLAEVQSRGHELQLSEARNKQLESTLARLEEDLSDMRVQCTSAEKRVEVLLKEKEDNISLQAQVERAQSLAVTHQELQNKHTSTIRTLALKSTESAELTLLCSRLPTVLDRLFSEPSASVSELQQADAAEAVEASVVGPRLAPDFWRHVVEAVHSVAGAPHLVSVFLPDPVCPGVLKLQALAGPGYFGDENVFMAGNQREFPKLRFPSGHQGLLGTCFKQQKSVLIEHSHQDVRFNEKLDSWWDLASLLPTTEGDSGNVAAADSSVASQSSSDVRVVCVPLASPVHPEQCCGVLQCVVKLTGPEAKRQGAVALPLSSSGGIDKVVRAEEESLAIFYTELVSSFAALLSRLLSMSGKTKCLLCVGLLILASV